MNLYPDLQDDVTQQCPVPDCLSTDTETVGLRADGLPEWQCCDCLTVFSDARPPVEA